MKHEIKDFIGVFHDVVSEEYCKEVIEFFEHVDELGGVYSRQDQESVSTVIKDNNIFHTDDKSPAVVFHSMFRLRRATKKAKPIRLLTHKNTLWQ